METKTAGLVAEPADQPDVLGQQVHLAHAIERVLRAGLIRIFRVGRRFAPLVDQRAGDTFSAAATAFTPGSSTAVRMTSKDFIVT